MQPRAPRSENDQCTSAGAPVPSIDIEKATNGHDADSPTGPEVTVGDAVSWTYVVTNTGEVALANVVVGLVLIRHA